MNKFAKLVSVIRGILEAPTVTKNEDLSEWRDEFVKDNFSMENNGSGVIITDSKHKYMPIQQKETPIPTGQLEAEVSGADCRDETQVEYKGQLYEVVRTYTKNGEKSELNCKQTAEPPETAQDCAGGD